MYGLLEIFVLNAHKGRRVVPMEVLELQMLKDGFRCRSKKPIHFHSFSNNSTLFVQCVPASACPASANGIANFRCGTGYAGSLIF